MAALTALAFDTTHGVKEATLCNHALYRLGGEVMKDSTEDTKISRVCRSVYAQTRDELLRNYPFGFAKKITKISWDEAYAKPIGEWSYAYKVTDPQFKTALWANASNVLTGVSVVTALTDDLIGRVVSGVGTGIAPGSRIVARTTNTLTLDKPTVAAGSADASRTASWGLGDVVLTSVSGAALTDAVIGYGVSGVGIAAGSKIIGRTGTTITMDTPATALGSTASISINPPINIELAPLKIVSIDNDSLFDLVDSGDDQRILCSVMSDATDGAEKLEICYVDQVVDPDLFDPLFRDALILRVASKVAMQITSTPRLVQQLQEEFAAIMNIAKQTAAQERQSEVPEETWTSQAKG